MIDSTDELRQDVIIKSRKQIEMSGVLDVNSFDEHEVVVQTNSACASIDGENLKIDRFNSQNGELITSNRISFALIYPPPSRVSYKAYASRRKNVHRVRKGRQALRCHRPLDVYEKTPNRIREALPSKPQPDRSAPKERSDPRGPCDRRRPGCSKWACAGRTS